MAYTTIDDPTKYFDSTIWTGSGGAKTITGLNHKPDLIWTKTRSVGYNHMWSDSSRGFNANSEIGSNSTGAEGGLSAETYGYKSGHTADGWTMVDGTDTVDGQEDGNTNQPNVTYVGWTWAANGGTTASNTDGDQTSTVQANTTAGFSIVTYSGDGTGNFTVGHGLGSTLDAIIVKRRDDTSNWYVWHKNLTSGSYVIYLNATNAQASESTVWNGTAPTSSVFTIGTDANLKTTGNYVAYCFVGKQGYSKFGGYTGNGNNSNGSFIYTGFKPKWLMIKRAVGGTQNWHVSDTSMKSTNENTQRLLPSLSAAEETRSVTDSIDFLSNGFKCNSNETILNTNGDTYIYWAFAENPFVSTTGIPATAR
jgi:hypothetical protein